MPPKNRGQKLPPKAFTKASLPRAPPKTAPNKQSPAEEPSADETAQILGFKNVYDEGYKKFLAGTREFIVKNFSHVIEGPAKLREVGSDEWQKCIDEIKLLDERWHYSRSDPNNKWPSKDIRDKALQKFARDICKKLRNKEDGDESDPPRPKASRKVATPADPGEEIVPPNSRKRTSETPSFTSPRKRTIKELTPTLTPTLQWRNLKTEPSTLSSAKPPSVTPKPTSVSPKPTSVSPLSSPLAFSPRSLLRVAEAGPEQIILVVLKTPHPQAQIVYKLVEAFAKLAEWVGEKSGLHGPMILTAEHRVELPTTALAFEMSVNSWRSVKIEN
jgi:hypothetical protein